MPHAIRGREDFSLAADFAPSQRGILLANRFSCQVGHEIRLPFFEQGPASPEYDSEDPCIHFDPESRAGAKCRERNYWRGI
jgi:hypothetical protein